MSAVLRVLAVAVSARHRPICWHAAAVGSSLVSWHGWVESRCGLKEKPDPNQALSSMGQRRSPHGLRRFFFSRPRLCPDRPAAVSPVARPWLAGSGPTPLPVASSGLDRKELSYTLWITMRLHVNHGHIKMTILSI